MPSVQGRSMIQVLAAADCSSIQAARPPPSNEPVLSKRRLNVQ